jgi:hypothetical protein
MGIHKNWKLSSTIVAILLSLGWPAPTVESLAAQQRLICPAGASHFEGIVLESAPVITCGLAAPVETVVRYRVDGHIAGPETPRELDVAVACAIPANSGFPVAGVVPGARHRVCLFQRFGASHPRRSDFDPPRPGAIPGFITEYVGP